jgi:hypothetical protein
MSNVLKFPAARLAEKLKAAKRKAIAEPERRDLMNAYNSLTEEGKDIAVAVLDLVTSRTASELARKRKRALALAARVLSEPHRAHVMQLIADWRPRDKAVTPLRGGAA